MGAAPPHFSPTSTLKGLTGAVRGLPRQGDAGAERDHQRGARLMREGAVAEAARLFERAVRRAPGVSLYWTNLANAQRKAKREDEALASARRAFDLDRGNVLACHLLAELLRAVNRRTEALAVLQALDPAIERSADHWWIEGELLFGLNRAEEAAQAMLQVLALKPGHFDAYMKLGFSLAWLKQYHSAAECFRTVTLCDAAQLGSAIYAVHYAAWACDWAQGSQDLTRMLQALALHADADESPAASPFCLVAIADDAKLQLRLARRESARLAHTLQQRVAAPLPAAGALPYAQARAALAQGRLRIGFVASDFRDHATSILMARLVEQLDRQRFEVLLYSHGADDGGPLRQRMQAAADRFVDCAEMGVVEQARRIQDDGCAVLIDLGGFTLNSRLQLFALRPAPVQASWLAFPGTTGADYVDYIIGDPVVTPLAHGADFSECIAQLPQSYQANDDRREHPEPVDSRRQAGLPEGAFVFGCFNQSYKFNDETFGSWMRILRRVPGSVLWLLVPQADVQARLRQQAEARGIAGDRLVFAPFVSQREHLARLPLADVMLDTFPCGAHTTCSDALWMGVPMVTRMGRTFASRVAASLLQAVGLAELAVTHTDDFEELSVRLAQDREALTEIRDHLWENRLDLPLFDSERFAQDFGALVDRMAARWLDGQPPAALAAQPAQG